MLFHKPIYDARFGFRDPNRRSEFSASLSIGELSS